MIFIPNLVKPHAHTPKKQEAALWQPHVTKPLTKTYPLELGESYTLNQPTSQTVHQKQKKINENINIVQAVITDKDDEELSFMITNNKASSSIFNFGTHAIEHPYVFEIERRQLKSITLNTLFERNNIPHDRYDFINIDIQGAELKALKGATHILPHIKAIYAEVNEKMLYEGAVLLPELDEYLATFNFKRVITNMTQHGWGDALYIKNYAIPTSP